MTFLDLENRTVLGDDDVREGPALSDDEKAEILVEIWGADWRENEMTLDEAFTACYHLNAHAVDRLADEIAEARMLRAARRQQ